MLLPKHLNFRGPNC